MNKYERREAEKLVIKAIEYYLNSYDYLLNRQEVTNRANLLNAYKNELIERIKENDN